MRKSCRDENHLFKENKIHNNMNSSKRQ
jgi:hypothetical protein